MKRKIIGYGLLLFLIIISSVSLLYRHKMTISQNQVASGTANIEIIAPAITDSLSDITHVPTLQAGTVKKIRVTVGQMVKKGQPLVSLDDTLAKHGVKISKLALQQAENSLISHQKHLKHMTAQFKQLESIDRRAVSRVELWNKKHEIKMANMQLKQFQDGLNIAKANLKNAELILNQYTTVAPKNGVILQINTQENEFVGGAHQVIFLGDAKKVMVRVSIDENDIKDFSPKNQVYLTSNDDDKLKIPLTFIQLNRYIITQERLNSRVQEALYFFDRDAYPNIASGQQFDAHIVLKTT